MEDFSNMIDGYKARKRFECTCCIMCNYFDGVNKGTCSSYPNGIPDKYAVRNMLGNMVVHLDVENNQIGNFTFSM